MENDDLPTQAWDKGKKAHNKVMSLGNVSNQVTGTCGTRSDLADYSNKQWGGLVSGFYSPRQQCYVQIVKQRGLPVKRCKDD